jgi:hypothetical protein
MNISYAVLILPASCEQIVKYMFVKYGRLIEQLNSDYDC